MSVPSAPASDRLQAVSITGTLPGILTRETPIVLEQDVTDEVHALLVTGVIASSAPAELRDLILHTDFLDADGAPIDAVGSGLSKADSGRYFFYPLGAVVPRTEQFKKMIQVPVGTRRVRLSLSLWRSRPGVQHTALAFDIRAVSGPQVLEHADMKTLLAALGQRGHLDTGGRVLDVAMTLPEPETTIEPITQVFATPIDCLAPSTTPRGRWVDIRRQLDVCRPCAAPSGPYTLISVHPHLFNLDGLVLKLRDLYSHLSLRGLIITTAQIAALDAAAESRGREKGDPSAWIAAVNAMLHRHSVPLEIAAVGKQLGGGATGHCWIVLRMTEIIRRVPEVLPELIANNLPAAAALARTLCLDILTGRSGPVTDAGASKQFAAQVPLLDKAGRYDAARDCLLCAAALDPDALDLRLEVAARFRGAGQTETALAIVRNLIKAYPGHAGPQMQQALILSETGRGLEAMDIGGAALNKLGANATVSVRRFFATLMRNFARECASAGIQTDLVDPLLDPEIAERFFADPEAHAQTWFRPRLNRFFQVDAIDRRAMRDKAQHDAGPVPGDRPLRVLMISGGPWTFVLKMVNALGPHRKQIELRSFDFAYLEESISKDHLHELFAPVSIGGNADEPWARVAAEQAVLAELVEWSDIVFCEWAAKPAIWLSRYLPAHKRLIVRLHSYEAFTSWPYFINFGGIDGLIFVADHIQKITDLRFQHAQHCPRSIVLQNFNDPSRFSTDKAPGANRTLGMLGYSNRNKDPLFAAQVLARLRQTDPSWRLHLVGNDWDEATLRETQRKYLDQFRAFVAENDLAAAIEQRPFTTRIEEPLALIGFIMSCSHREGTHEAILEGMATGSIPVIRRWPMVRRFGAPGSSYPGLACVDTVDEAVAQILSQCTPEAFAAGSAKAAAYARRQFDLAATSGSALQFFTDVAMERSDNELGER